MSSSENIWDFSETPLELSGGDYTYTRRLLVGILNKEVDNNRSWCPMYGYTEIAPGRIRVNKIVSTNGKTWFDLVKNEIAGRINFLDGLISGLIGVAGETGQINAGMNGKGNAADAIRFWAGATEAGMDNAPYRVQNDGKVFMGNSEIYGACYTTGFFFNKEVFINKDNYTDFIFDDVELDFRKYGSNFIFEDDEAIGNIVIRLLDTEVNGFTFYGGSPIDFIDKTIRMRRSKSTTKGFLMDSRIYICLL